jgi:hypothetical protein
VVYKVDNFVNQIKIALMTTAEDRLLEEELRPFLVKNVHLKVAAIAKAVVNVRFKLEHKPDNAVDRAKARGLFLREAAKQEEGGSISADEAARRLGISKTSVLKRLKKGRLLGWRETKQRAARFPVWQFSEDGILTGLSEVLSILSQSPQIDDWGRIMFFLNPRASLEGRHPLEALREGHVSLVERLAWGDAER